MSLSKDEKPRISKIASMCKTSTVFPKFDEKTPKIEKSIAVSPEIPDFECLKTK